MRRVGSPLTGTRDHVRWYGDRVEYHTNTALPDHVHTLPRRVTDLVVAGHDPHPSVLECLEETGCHLWGFYGTVFDHGEEDCLTTHLRSNAEPRFSLFTYVSQDGRLTHCDTWDTFLRAARAYRVIHVGTRLLVTTNETSNVFPKCLNVLVQLSKSAYRYVTVGFVWV